MKTTDSPIIVGLDIGTTKVVAIAARKNQFGKLEVVGFGRADSKGVNHGVVQNLANCTDSIKKAVENLRENNPQLDVHNVYVGIAGQHIKSIPARGDRMRANADDIITPEEVKLLINDQSKTHIPAGDQIIDIIPTEFSVDSHSNLSEKEVIGMNGTKFGANFHIITGDKSAIRNIERCVRDAGLKTIDIVLQPLASAASVLADDDLEAGVILVDIGGGTTDMAVFIDDILQHTAVIPFAGANITNDIKVGLAVLKAHAELLKVQFGSAIAEEASGNQVISIPGIRELPARHLSCKNLSNIIQARMEEILEYVVYHLKQNDLDKKLNGGIILTGGGSSLKNLKQLTEFKTGLNTRIGLPIEHLAGDYDPVLANPMYSTCIGLILKGFSDIEKAQPIVAKFEETEEELTSVSNEAHAENQKSSVATQTDSSLKVEETQKKYADKTLFDEDIEQEDVAKKTPKKGIDIQKRLKLIFGSIRTNILELFTDKDDEHLN